MSKVDEAIQYSRAIQCNNLQHLGTTDLDTFLKMTKEDWNLRATMDASSYVCALPQASEEQIRASGKGDVEREFVPRIEGLNTDVVLEIGAGFGRMSMFIAPLCKKLYAVDISGELLSQGRKRLSASEYQHTEFIETDGMHLDGVPDDFVDVVFEYTVFQHCSSKEVITAYIHEMNRVLKIDGVAILHGRDVPADTGDTSIGNTWHGCRCGEDLVRKSIAGTTLRIEKEEGVGTDRYWVTLVKDLVYGV